MFYDNLFLGKIVLTWLLFAGISKKKLFGCFGRQVLRCGEAEAVDMNSGWS